MLHYELLKSAATLCRLLTENDIMPSDVYYVPLFEEYERLKREGHKMTYIVFYLSDKYECSEAAVYRIVRRLGRKMRV